MDVLEPILTSIFSYLRLITIADIIDVAVIAFVIYKCMGMLRKGSAAQVTKAILFIIIALWLSYQLNLDVINFILSKAVSLGLLAILIVFQPEIRRFLETIGSNDFRELWGVREMPITELENAIVETVKAYEDLAKDKVGALTVFERKISLDSVISSGTVLDGAVTSELMKNIFYPKAPLHDGAVVVRNGRLAGAGCTLPLSSNLNLSRDLGMRHKAGIGASEHSDVIVAIVSEETGAISVASDGRLQRHLSPETLEQILRNELLPKEVAGEKPSQFRWLEMLKKKGEAHE